MLCNRNADEQKRPKRPSTPLSNVARASPRATDEAVAEICPGSSETANIYYVKLLNGDIDLSCVVKMVVCGKFWKGGQQLLPLGAPGKQVCRGGKED